MYLSHPHTTAGCPLLHAPGLVLAAELNRTAVLPRLLLDGSAAEFG